MYCTRVRACASFIYLKKKIIPEHLLTHGDPRQIEQLLDLESFLFFFFQEGFNILIVLKSKFPVK